MRHRQYSERHGRVAGVHDASKAADCDVGWWLAQNRDQAHAGAHTPSAHSCGLSAVFCGCVGTAGQYLSGVGGWRRDYDRIATRASCVRACVCLDTHSDGATKPRAAAAAAVDAPAGGRRNCVWE